MNEEVIAVNTPVAKEVYGFYLMKWGVPYCIWIGRVVDSTPNFTNVEWTHYCTRRNKKQFDGCGELSSQYIDTIPTHVAKEYILKYELERANLRDSGLESVIE